MNEILIKVVLFLALTGGLGVSIYFLFELFSEIRDSLVRHRVELTDKESEALSRVRDSHLKIVDDIARKRGFGWSRFWFNKATKKFYIKE